MPDSPNTPAKAKKELSMEMRMLIAFLLMGLVFIVTPLVLPQKPEAPVKKAETPKSAPAGVDSAKQGTSSSAAIAPADPKAAPAAATPATAASAEETFTLETDVYRVVFSNRGATVKSWTLKKFKDSAGKPVELVNPKAVEKAGWPMAYEFKDGRQRKDLNQALFAGTMADGGLTADFRYSDGSIVAHKVFKLNRNQYRLQIQSEVTEGGTQTPHLLAWRGGFGDRTVHNAYSTQHTVRYEVENAKLITEEAKIAKDGPVSVNGSFSFAGLEDTFFAFVVLGGRGQTLEIRTWGDQLIPEGATSEELHVGAAVGGSGRNDLSVYLGPKDLDILRSVDPKLEGLVDYGWFAILAKPLFLALHWVNDNLINNWGWSIVFVTVIINFLLLPLRFSSIRSMQKMATIQPQVKELNDRYKNVGLRDPKMQQKNEELMALYQKNGINPMGGCLPMVLQMPFFFAFYKVLSVSIELRGAPWLWVTDLSQPETLFIRLLPLLMIVTQVIMQKMTPSTTADPNQQRMMLLMPVMLGFLFYTASSGLVLYWLTGNVVGIFQQYFFNRYASATAPVPSAAASAAITKKKKS